MYIFVYTLYIYISTYAQICLCRYIKSKFVCKINTYTYIQIKGLLYLDMYIKHIYVYICVYMHLSVL